MSINYRYDKKRFEAFIDAVIAILLTILVLEIRVPEEAKTASTHKQIFSVIPHFISYIATFSLIVSLWLDYHLLFLNVSHLTKRFILLNMLFILSLSVAPFSTAFAGENHNDAFAVALLGANYFVMNLFFYLLYTHARIKKLVDMQFFIDNKGEAVYAAIGIAFLLLSIPLAYVNTYVSFALYIIIFSGHLIRKI